MKPLEQHQLARQDVEQAVDYYLTQGGTPLALRWLDAYENALTHIARHPGTGSPRYARPCGVRGLRFWLLSDFPFAVFYIDRGEHIDIVRVLHQASDLPRQLPTHS